MLDVSLRTNAGMVAMEFSEAARDMRDKATMRALNEVAAQGKVAAARQIRDTGYKLPVGMIKKGIVVTRASTADLRAAVRATGQPLPLIAFSARPTSKGVSVSVLKGRKLIPGAFIATMANGHRGVFVRTDKRDKGTASKPKRRAWEYEVIRELFGPSVPDGMANEQVRQAFEKFVDDLFPRLLDREFAYLSKVGRGGGRR